MPSPRTLPLDPLAHTALSRWYVPLASSERALDALKMQLRECRSPVLLRGPSGSGKTLLLHELAERERSWAHRVRLSLSLERARDELAGWLLHYLFGKSVPESGDVEVALVEGIRGLGRERMLLFVDQIHRAPRDSVRKLAELARAGKPELTVVVAAADGEDLLERIADLAPEATVTLPGSIPDAEIEALYDAILVDPGLSRPLRARLEQADRGEILRAAAGVPLLLKQELLRWDERPARATPTLREVAVEPPGSPEPCATGPMQTLSELPLGPSRARLLVDAPRALVRAVHGGGQRARARLSEVALRAVHVSRTRLRDTLARATDGAKGIFAVTRRAGAASRAQLAGAGVSARAAFDRGRRGADAWRGSLYARRARAQMRLVETGRRASGILRHLSTALSRRRHEAIGRVQRVARARLDSLRATSSALLLAARTATRQGAVALVDARRAMRRAIPRVAVPASALVVLALLNPRGTESIRQELPAVSAGPSVTVQVNARPWARVRIDGQELGPTPLSRELAPGVYQLEARFPDGQTIRRNIEVSPERRFISLP